MEKTKITNCTFIGVQWTKEATKAIDLIAQGLIENAKGLQALTSVLKSSNVSIETLMQIQPKKTK